MGAPCEWRAPDLPVCLPPSDTQDFKFLFDLDCTEHAYYRWRVFSLAQGDLLPRWRAEPFQMIAGGSLWRPPRVEDVPVPAPVGHNSGSCAVRVLEDAHGGASTAAGSERELTDAQRKWHGLWKDHITLRVVACDDDARAIVSIGAQEDEQREANKPC